MCVSEDVERRSLLGLAQEDIIEALCWLYMRNVFFFFFFFSKDSFAVLFIHRVCISKDVELGNSVQKSLEIIYEEQFCKSFEN